MEKAHFIGIGGIGVSALAKYYLKKGFRVSGSDLVSSEIIESLKKQGAKIFTGKHSAKNLIKNASLVIYSPAVQSGNPELKEARKRKIKIQSYPQVLGQLTREYFTIAVSGTHGKSTTTAMLGLLFIKAGFDPTIILGTKLKELGNSNCRVGKSQYLIIEADEHFASFLNYWPRIIVLTTVEEDHLDYYKNLKNIISAFKKYLGHLDKDGILIANKDDNNVLRLSRKIKNTVYYSLKQKDSKKLKSILRAPGEHNISNALAALSVARTLKIPDKISFQALSSYTHAWRRFEIHKIKIKGKRITLISDYGHHPTEVRVTLKAAREKYPKKKILCVFQPHQYQRTYYLFRDFVKIFKKSPVDNMIITDIYDVAGREEKEIKKQVSAEKLVEAINENKTIYVPKKELLGYLEKNLETGQVLIIMGAGDIYGITLSLTESGKRKKIY
ncbi:MAG: UDP-N-acetylmuramate--L-alanine ligase [Candidatus Nealsonbacteria bacterium]|nr:UDP-N-acetylmuramate--L-alanine ligase [Candidatus Nealsonbacteria bacterium]